MTNTYWEGAVTVLEKMQEWFSVEERWTPGTAFRDAEGNATDGTKKPCAMCAMGALAYYTQRESMVRPVDAFFTARHLLYAVVDPHLSISRVSDSGWDACKRMIDAALEGARSRAAMVVRGGGVA